MNRRPEDRLPWNTGKVQIGLHYVPPPRRYEMSRDAENLQTLLLKKKSRPHINFVVAYAIALLVACIVMSMYP